MIVKDDDATPLSNSSSNILNKQRFNHETLGIMCCLLTEFIWTLNSVCLKYTTKTYNSLFKNKTFIFARGFATMIISFIFGKIYDGKIYKLSDFPSQIKKCILIRANISFFAMCFSAIAVFYLRITTYQIISALSPILVIFFSIIFLNEKYYSRYAFGIVFGIIGSATIIFNEKKIKAKKDFNLYEIFIGVISILMNISLSAIISVSNKIMAKNKISIFTQLFYLGAFHCLYSFLWMLVTLDFDYTFGYLFLCIMQSLIFFSANYFMFCSQKMFDLSKTSLFQYTKVVYVFILGSLIIKEKVFITDIIGSCIIVGFIIYNFLNPIK